MNAEPSPLDFLLVGGGLANALIALAVLEQRPDARILLVEREQRVGGEHTWCFHEQDVPAKLAEVIDGLIEFRWAGYEVRFPRFQRKLGCPYRGFGAERLARRVEEAFAKARNAELRLGTSVSGVGQGSVLLESGERLRARWVIDARGPRPEQTRGRSGYQIFVGHEVLLTAPHGLTVPIVMDATVEQVGGYRFVYVLPLGERRLLVEDTVFADGPELDEALFAERLGIYMRLAGWRVEDVVRQERGVLPMEFTGCGPEPMGSGLLRVGYGGGWVHPATGYSFPLAARLAARVAACEDLDKLPDALAPLANEVAVQSRYGRFLNRLLFRWYGPESRVDVFRRFYRLPEELISRFYALRMLRRDRFRILVGRPPRGLSIRARSSAKRRLS